MQLRVSLMQILPTCKLSPRCSPFSIRISKLQIFNAKFRLKVDNYTELDVPERGEFGEFRNDSLNLLDKKASELLVSFCKEKARM